MTTAELLREARAIVPPAGATKAIAVVDGDLRFRAAFLIGGRIRSAPVGPEFDKPRAVGRFVDILNGEAPRRATTHETPGSQNPDDSVLDASAVPPAAGAFQDLVPTSSEAVGGDPLPAASRDAGATPSRRPPPPGIPTRRLA